MEGFMKHPDPAVNHAIIRLCDAICSWERTTGRQSALIIREQGGFVFRAFSGKPGIPEHITDEDFLLNGK